MVWILVISALLLAASILATGFLLRRSHRNHQREIAHLREELNALREQSGKELPPPAKDDPVSPEVQYFLNDVNQLIYSGLSSRQAGVEQIAGMLNMSVQTFRRRLQSATGQSPKAYISGIQMEHAAKMLSRQTDIPVNEVAVQCGFDDLSSFGHSFKRIYGLSPSKYREKYRKMVENNQ